MASVMGCALPRADVVLSIPRITEIMMATADAVGIIGVICYQIAYAGLQLNRLQRDSKLYLALNLIGPCCLQYSLVFHFNLAAAISQWLWLMWSVVGVVVTVRTRRRQAARSGEMCRGQGRRSALGSDVPR